jgi:hypothetical protein
MHKSNPYLQAALLCEGLTTDDKGRNNIHNEFSQYMMGYSQPFTVLTIWRGAPDNAGEQFSEKMEIVAPDGRVVAAGENGPFSLPDSTYRQVNSIMLENVDFTGEGVYELRVTLADTQGAPVAAGVYPITVV